MSYLIIVVAVYAAYTKAHRIIISTKSGKRRSGIKNYKPRHEQ